MKMYIYRTVDAYPNQYVSAMIKFGINTDRMTDGSVHIQGKSTNAYIHVYIGNLNSVCDMYSKGGWIFESYFCVENLDVLKTIYMYLNNICH